MNTRRLTITLSDRKPRLDVPSLVTALQDTVGILHDVDHEMSSKAKASCRWYIVSAKMESPFTATLEAITSREDTGHEDDVIPAFLRGMRQIEKGGGFPDHFTADALVRAKRIVGLLNNGVSKIEYSAHNEETVRPTQHLAANVDLMLGASEHSYEAMTELDGRLEAISVHGKTPDFCIYDPLTNRPIHCTFDPEELKRLADLIKSRARLRVCGTAEYDPNGQPESMKVETFSVLLEQADLPQIADLHKAKIDITQGEDSVNFVRKLRDAG